MRKLIDKNLYIFGIFSLLITYQLGCKSQQAGSDAPRPIQQGEANNSELLAGDDDLAIATVADPLCESALISKMMFSSSSQMCALAKDSCSLKKLASMGYSQAMVGECINFDESKQICTQFIQAVAMYDSKSSSCSFAGDGCQVDQLVAEGYEVAAKGVCDKPTSGEEQCVQFIQAEKMFHPTSGKCSLAGDGCAVEDLKTEGYVQAVLGQCTELASPNYMCALFIRAQPMYKATTDQCALAGDGCAVKNFEAIGYVSDNNNCF